MQEGENGLWIAYHGLKLPIMDRGIGGLWSGWLHRPG